MAYSDLEALQRGIHFKYGADENTPAATTGQSPEVPIFIDDRLVESEATNTLEQGYSLVNKVTWLPVDTFNGGATGPTINVNRKTPTGVGAAPSAAPTAALQAAAGNVTAGTHLYAFTYVVNGVETPLSAASASMNADATHGQVALTAVTAGPTGTTARRIYGTLAGTTAPYFLVGELLDNTTTTFTVNVADASNNESVQELVPAPGQTITVATYTFSTNNNAVAWSPVQLTLTGGAVMYVGTGEALSFQIVQNSTGQALSGGRVFVDLKRR